MSPLSSDGPFSRGREESVPPSVPGGQAGGENSFAGLVSDLYGELHRMAVRALSSERSEHTLQPTALIHELYLRLQAGKPPDFRGRAHFFALAAKTMRRILIDHARARRAERRGAGQVLLPLEDAENKAGCSQDDLLTIDEALDRLEQADARAARVTELWFFGGLEQKEIAEELGISLITVKRDWKFARAWLASHFKSRLS